jgi:hypothetical protein
LSLRKKFLSLVSWLQEFAACARRFMVVSTVKG